MERKKVLSLLPKVVASLTSLFFLLAYFFLDVEHWMRTLLMIAFVLCSSSAILTDSYRDWKTERTRGNKWKMIFYFIYVMFMCAYAAYIIATRPAV
ncbi:hypothetical protein [Clostridium sp. D33t1_170424_F3]|uniref:hypothetical protein n=1 Tax=Clostridium sp. D33t1_170424_F3 TaxID=2787099 RepID=UPI0018AB50B6|nr:hypothetical protein [Clostridium sp. D33t1_170424_F3]